MLEIIQEAINNFDLSDILNTGIIVSLSVLLLSTMKLKFIGRTNYSLY